MVTSDPAARRVRLLAGVAFLLTSGAAIGSGWLLHYAVAGDGENLGLAFVGLLVAPLMGPPAATGLAILAWAVNVATRDGWSALRTPVTAALRCGVIALVLPAVVVGYLL